jgi:hypothetical protein
MFAPIYQFAPWAATGRGGGIRARLITGFPFSGPYEDVKLKETSG